MRISEAALALITRVNAQDEAEYLTQWNEKWQAYSLIGGHREEGESFRECCLREVEEELGLKRIADFTVAAKSVGSTVDFTMDSMSAGEETRYGIELFRAEIASANVYDAVNAAPLNRWLSASEIENRMTEDGRTVSEQVFRVLIGSGILKRDSGESSLNSKHDSVPTVTWIADARRDLGDGLRRQLDRELLQAFAERRASDIIVKQRFRGFTDLPQKKLIIAVEVQSALGSHASVVKIGDAGEVRGDHDGWQSCAAQRGVASRMFIAPLLRELSNDRAAIIYPDVYQYYFNNGRDDEPKELEVIVEQSVLRDTPTAASVERVLTQVFTEAHRCFYRDAQEDMTGEVILTGVTKSLRFGEPDPVLDRWRQLEFLQLRRGAVWLTSGRRKPESLVRPEYVDPVDFIDWAVRHRHFPRMLTGPAHGDLHGRNVIVGVVRGEAEWPAVFDFDKMTNHNLVAWDFAKLEMELKCRLFQQLLDTPEEQDELRSLLDIPARRPLPPDIKLSPDELRVQQRIDRMEVMYAVEKRLHAWTRLISSAGQAARRGVAFLPEFSTDTPMGRAMRIICRIRREAAISLGYERQGREALWSDEYYFALATYGVVAAKWHSANDHMAWSLLSAGVAAASLSLLPWPPNPDVPPSVADAPTYLHLLPYSAKCWAESDKRNEMWNLPLPSLNEGVERFPYAVPLKQQIALLRAQSSVNADVEASRRDIESIANLACVFRDHETLCRLGRVYKDQGDHEFGDDDAAFKEIVSNAHPAFQYYHSAFTLYDRAFQVSGDYYPAINAATLALLIGRHDRQKELAQMASDLCRNASLSGPDRAWVLATEGEAALLLGKPQDAVRFYRAAIEAILPQELGVMQSVYNQLCRLYWALGPDVVQPVIEMLAEAGRLQSLDPGPFNNCGLPSKPTTPSPN